MPPFELPDLPYLNTARFIWDEIASPEVAPGVPFENAVGLMMTGLNMLAKDPEHHTTAGEALPAMLIHMAKMLHDRPDLIQRLTLLVATKEPGNASEESH
jgi:hypothetical protein